MLRDNFKKENPGERVYEDRVLEKIAQGAKCAEIGVFNGAFSRKIFSKNPSEIHLVDPWVQQTDQHDQHAKDSQEEQDARFQKVKNWADEMSSDETKISVYRDFSENAAKNFSNNYFDWIYIDGDHRYEAVKIDLESWWPKLKPGGWITGDDYTQKSDWGAVEAVNQFAMSIGLTPPHENTLIAWKTGNTKLIGLSEMLNPGNGQALSPHYRVWCDTRSLDMMILGTQFFIRKRGEFNEG